MASVSVKYMQSTRIIHTHVSVDSRKELYTLYFLLSTLCKHGKLQARNYLTMAYLLDIQNGIFVKPKFCLAALYQKI